MKCSACHEDMVHPSLVIYTFLMERFSLCEKCVYAMIGDMSDRDFEMFLSYAFMGQRVLAC